MTPRYGISVHNLTTGQELHVTQGDKPNVIAPLQLVDPFRLSSGFDRYDYPVSLQPVTATINLLARSAADVPDWQPGHVLRVRVVVPIDYIGAGGWWLVDPNDNLDRPRPYADHTLVISPLGAVARRLSSDTTGMAVTVVAVEPINRLAGIPIHATWPQQATHQRWSLLDDHLPATLCGYPVTSGFVGSTRQVGPVEYTGETFGSVLASLCAGDLDNGSPGNPPSLTVPVVFGKYDLGTGALTWVAGGASVPRDSDGIDTPYELVMVGTQAVARLRTPVPEDSGVGTFPALNLDACHVRTSGTAWANEPEPNTVNVGTINTDGTPNSKTQTLPDLVARDGTITRQVSTQVWQGSADTDLLDFYLGDASGVGSWSPRNVVIMTERIPDDELTTLATALRFGAAPPIGINHARVTAQLVVYNVDEDLRLGANSMGSLAGTLIGHTLTVAGGRLEFDCTVIPYVPRPMDDGPDTAVTFQNLKDDPVLSTVRCHNSPPGSNHIDPALTIADMRLIGV